MTIEYECARFRTEPEFCIRITSSEDGAPICNEHWKGDPIEIKQNDVVVATIPADFTDFQHCMSYDSVDLENDEFKLDPTDTDGVSDTLWGNVTLRGVVVEVVSYPK